MPYNPLFDLVIGLFLILVPVFIVIGLIYILFFQNLAERRGDTISASRRGSTAPINAQA